ncbi:SAM-dependent methyltransferase, partial [Bacteroides uniformis]
IYKVKKLHPNSHLYTSGEPIKNFPGRSFRITGICTLNKKELKSVLGDLKKANITVRNFPSSVAELRKRIKLSEGGEVYLFATTLINEQKVLIRCEKI